MKGNEGKGRSDETRKVAVELPPSAPTGEMVIVYVIRKNEDERGGVTAIEADVPLAALHPRRTSAPCFPWEAEAKITLWIDERKRKGGL